MATKLHICPRCEARWNADGLHVDPARKCVSWSGGDVRLSPLESRLMQQFAAANGNVVRHGRLVDAAWGQDADGGPDNAFRAIYVHMAHLRKRLAKAGFPGRIRSVWGIGYELTLQAA
jgi:DNA-binding response OmpR family regulator